MRRLSQSQAETHVLKTFGTIAVIMQLAGIVLGVTLLPLLAGLWLDERLGTMPWLTLVALPIGVVGGVTAVYRTISSLYRQP